MAISVYPTCWMTVVMTIEIFRRTVRTLFMNDQASRRFTYRSSHGKLGGNVNGSQSHLSSEERFFKGRLPFGWNDLSAEVSRTPNAVEFATGEEEREKPHFRGKSWGTKCRADFSIGSSLIDFRRLSRSGTSKRHISGRSLFFLSSFSMWGCAGAGRDEWERRELLAGGRWEPPVHHPPDGCHRHSRGHTFDGHRARKLYGHDILQNWQATSNYKQLLFVQVSVFKTPAGNFLRRIVKNVTRENLNFHLLIERGPIPDSAFLRHCSRPGNGPVPEEVNHSKRHFQKRPWKTMQERKLSLTNEPWQVAARPKSMTARNQLRKHQFRGGLSRLSLSLRSNSAILIFYPGKIIKSKASFLSEAGKRGPHSSVSDAFKVNRPSSWSGDS